MDNTSNGQNKLIVLLAVAIVGAAAGQHLLKPAAPPTQPMGQWGPGYAMQPPPVGYAPTGYAQPNYGMPPMAAPYAVNGQMPQFPQPMPSVVDQTTTRHADAAGSSPSLRIASSATHRADTLVRRAGYSPESEPFVPSPAPEERDGVDLALTSTEPARSLSTTLAPVALGQSAGSLSKPEIAYIEVQEVLWNQSYDKVLLSSRTAHLYLRISGTVQEKTKVVATDATIEIAPSSPLPNVFGEIYGPVPFTVSGDTTSVVLAVSLARDGSAKSDASRKVTLYLPTLTGGPSAGTILAKTNRLKVPKSAAGGIDLHERFLELSGIGATGASQIVVVACGKSVQLRDKYEPIAVRQTPTRPDSNGKWAMKPDLNGLPNPEGQLLILAEGDQSKYAYATPIKFTLKASASIASSQLSIDSITQHDGGSGATFVAMPGGRGNQRRLRITGTVPVDPPVDDGMAVLLVNGKEIEASKQDLQDATFEYVWTAANDGVYQFKIGIVQGDQLIEPPDSQTVEIRRTGPKVIGISPDNLALTPGVNVIDVQFSGGDLDGESLAPGQFVFAKTLVVNTADLIAGNKVRLTLGDVPEGAYKLTVKPTAPGGKTIHDLFGNLLGATHEDPAGKESAGFGVIKPVGSELSSSPSVGLSNLTGPYVPYQEYTDPRKSQTGFNPSDKVVTRVARLYYYRDAHRVVQLINRGARSYNRQAVDMQQQLADNARRDAENATGERRSAERTAIQAAQRARASETALTQFQQALVTARQQQVAAEAEQLQHQRTHSTLEDDLEDATAARQTLEQTDTSMMSVVEKSTHTASLKLARRDEITKSRKLEASDQKGTQHQADVTTARGQVADAERHVNALLAEIQNARNEEAQQRETLDRRQFEEDSKHKDLFRREVAAAHEDPDTFAPGKPDSQDPIEQVSLSVIGEGLIQLRGPLKGVNLARTLINQIDAPVGQVKVAIHTVQVNGEHGKRMEPVIGRIQRYIDHSRFLTTQSGQMLRNSVTLVASRRADQAMILCEGASQTERDQKYIEAFFGREFLAELRTLDSEFLHTGNKLLSLHSMDSTSLANALFLLSLAKNDVRHEILTEFERMVTCQLPTDEMEYFTASNEKYKFGPMFHKQKFVFLGHNAKFVSLKGFFNADVAGSDTMTPMQREFIRLAQIFKSRLVTEIELQQRVMERSLIERRGDNDEQAQGESLAKEKEAINQLEVASATRQRSQVQIKNALVRFGDEVRRVLDDARKEIRLAQVSGKSQISNDTSDTIKLLADDLPRLKRESPKTISNQKWTIYGLDEYPDFRYWVGQADDGEFWIYTLPTEDAARVNSANKITIDPESVLRKLIEKATKAQLNSLSVLGHFRHEEPYSDYLEEADRLLRSVDETVKGWATEKKKLEPAAPTPSVAYSTIVNLQRAATKLEKVDQHVLRTANRVNEEAVQISLLLTGEKPDLRGAYSKWNELYRFLDGRLLNQQLRQLLETESAKVNAQFVKLSESHEAEETARRQRESRRRPLDHKKYMDMLIDDVEDKFIELMEGTRAHTANIDNYLSRLGQALEDDFNTQFYFPAFKGIREASRFWDVNMGQIETTTILTNNRMLAKVSPQATMEFDLPKRDILIDEAFKSAQAAYQDYGALLGDPTFLSLTKMHRGQPASALFGSDASNPAIRNVLPSLPSSTDEKMVAQNRAVAPDFPSALESLIPDPAIYKFETGTGYEIRPVIQPDGQAVVFHFNYMYTTNVREPVRADEKHLGRVKRHFIDTDVQTGNYELREVSKYQVALKASRTSRGVPLLEDIPGAGVLFRPQPSQESSIQENIILAQSVIFPTLFDLMGLRWAPAVADLDSLRLQEADFVTRSRQRGLRERVFDHSSQQVDEFLRIPESERRADLYRAQETTPHVHPNGYSGPGLGLKDGVLREGYAPEMHRPESRFAPGTNPDGAIVPEQLRGEGLFQEGPEFPIPLERLGAPPRFGEPDHVVPAPSVRRSNPTAPSNRTSNAPGKSRVQLQSYSAESPSAAKAAPSASAPRGSRPIPKPAGSPPGSPPGFLPNVSPPPQRLPADAGGQQSAVGAEQGSTHSKSSPTMRSSHVQPAKDITPAGTARSSQIVQVGATESGKFEPAQPAAPVKKKFGPSSLWPRKP